jgi:hypothetical protein
LDDVLNTGPEILREQVEHTREEIVRLEADVREQGTTITGARGQIIAHPALAVLARLRKVLAELLDKLGELPTETQSQKASRAARTRWQRGRKPISAEERFYVPGSESGAH